MFPEFMEHISNHGQKVTLRKEEARKYAGKTYTGPLIFCAAVAVICIVMYLLWRIPYSFSVFITFSIATLICGLIIRSKIKLAESGNYEVYRLEVKEKLWYADTDSDGTAYSFYVRSGDVTIEIGKKQYMLVRSHILAFVYPVRIPPFKADYEFFAD